MENYSRTQKYEKLRRQLENDRESEIKTKELSDYAERLNTLDNNRFEKMDVLNQEEHDPLHARNTYYEDETSVQIPFGVEKKEEKESIEDKFNTDFINEYIKEVKQYNFDKGLRSAEDTQLNILKEVRKGNDPMLRPFGEIEGESKGGLELPENIIKAIDEQEEIRNTISLEIKNILAQEQTEQKSEEITNQENKEVEQVDSAEVEETEEKNKDLDVKVFNQPPHEHITSEDIENIVINQTREIKAQLESYESELDDMSNTVSNTNRLLNIVLVTLIIALLIVLGIIVYWNLMKRGII